MPPYMYVKIIWWITSYSMLFILKRNTGNHFYLLLYVRLSGTFLEKVHQKMLFITMRFRLFTCHFLFGCLYMNGYPLTTPLRTNNWSGTAYWWEARLIEARIIEVLLCIQGVSRLWGITAGGDFLGLCDEKSSYKHVSDFGRLRSYGRFLIPVHALVWTLQNSWRVAYFCQLQTVQFLLSRHLGGT
jgi:hypothetical protein